MNNDLIDFKEKKYPHHKKAINNFQMPIYDLNNTYFLKNDIEIILREINSLYKIDSNQKELVFTSRTLVNNQHHWTSEICKETFNKLIPTIKSLHKDMYAVLETIFKSRNGRFNIALLEKKYPHLKEFRLLNNKFKHFNDKQAEINLTQIVMIEPQGHLIDVYCNFKYENSFEGFRFCVFIAVFLTILAEEKIINILHS